MKFTDLDFSSKSSVNLIKFGSLEPKKFDECIQKDLTQSLDHIGQDIESGSSETSYCQSISSSASIQQLDLSGSESCGYESLSESRVSSNSSSQCLSSNASPKLGKLML
jgi:hypothetical protein